MRRSQTGPTRLKDATPREEWFTAALSQAGSEILAVLTLRNLQHDSHGLAKETRLNQQSTTWESFSERRSEWRITGIGELF